MSFPRAKLHRFNEISSHTPSPAQYNPCLKGSTNGSIISKSGRFVEPQSPASSETNSFQLHTSFKTPNTPRKLKCLRTLKTDVVFHGNDDTEALREKIVECNNKDLYIQELSEQIEDLKQALSDLGNKVSLLENENGTVLKESNTRIKMQIKYREEILLLKNKVKQLNEILRELKSECTTVKTENVNNLTCVLNNITTLNELIANIQMNYNTLLSEKEELNARHQKEIQQLEIDTLKTITNMHSLIEEEKQNAEDRLNEYKINKELEISDLQNKYKALHDDFEAKVKQLEENHKEATILSEILMKEKCEDIERGWKMKLLEVETKTQNALKEYQIIAERNALQNDIEKEKVLNDLSQHKDNLNDIRKTHLNLKTDYETLQNEHKSLRVELSNIIIELNSTREESSKKLQQSEMNVTQAVRDKNLYELTIQKTHKTVEALKKRLMKSDHDVEQLKAELEATEESKLEVEGKCNHLMEELEIVTGLCDVIEDQNDLAIRVAEERIKELEEELLNKVDLFRTQANDKIKPILNELEKTKEELRVVKQHLYEQSETNTKAQECLEVAQFEIDRLELLTKEYHSQILSLESAYNDVQEQLLSLKLANTAIDECSKLKTVIELMQASENDLLKQIKDLKQQLTHKTSECDRHLHENTDLRKGHAELEERFNNMAQELDSLQAENCQLRKTVCEQDALIGPFRSNLQAYEMEYTVLLSEKNNIEKEAKDIALKYAQILGHQNHKQKIKHLVDLKKQNFKLTEDKKALEHKIRSQARLIERIQLSQAETPKKKGLKDKENVNLSLNSSSRIDSPGPLKDVN